MNKYDIIKFENLKNRPLIAKGKRFYARNAMGIQPVKKNIAMALIAEGAEVEAM